ANDVTGGRAVIRAPPVTNGIDAEIGITVADGDRVAVEDAVGDRDRAVHPIAGRLILEPYAGRIVLEDAVRDLEVLDASEFERTRRVRNVHIANDDIRHVHAVGGV